VTIGLVQLLSVGEIGLPQVFHIKSPPQNFKSPFGFKFSSTHRLNGNDIVAVICVLASIEGGPFFRFTNTASRSRLSESSEGRRCSGFREAHQHHRWVMATVLATVGLIMRAGVVGLPIGSALGLPIMVRALPPPSWAGWKSSHHLRGRRRHRHPRAGHCLAYAQWAVGRPDPVRRHHRRSSLQRRGTDVASG